MPRELIEAAVRSRLHFFSLYGDTHLVLVRIRPGDEALAAGLAATLPRASDGSLLKSQVPAMGYNTQVISEVSSMLPPEPPGQQPSDFDKRALAERVRTGSYFVLPLHKRDEVEAMFAERVTVGRAPNKDIVLRHASVSKFHAWFELDDCGRWCVADAGSKNGTRLDGAGLAPRQLELVGFGRTVRFGSVDVLLCPPELFYQVVSAEVRATRG